MFPQVLERIAEVAVRVSVIGLDGECLVVACHSLIQLHQVLERSAEVAVCLCVIGFDGEGFCNEINSDVILTRLMGNHTEQMQGDGLVGITLQYLLVNIFSLRQATRVVVLDGEVDGLLDS